MAKDNKQLTRLKVTTQTPNSLTGLLIKNKKTMLLLISSQGNIIWFESRTWQVLSLFRQEVHHLNHNGLDTLLHWKI